MYRAPVCPLPARSCRPGFERWRPPDSSRPERDRLRRRENIFVGHRTFLFHRLVSAGWTHAGASTLYIPLPIVGALLAVSWDKGSRPLHEFVVLATVAACYALWFLVRHEERRTSAYGVLPEVVTEALFDGVYAAQPEPELMLRRGA
jgi:hypothetical protein